MFQPSDPTLIQIRLAPAALLALLVLATAGCTRVPEIEDRLTADLRAADYPALLPLDETVPPLPAPAKESEKLEQELKARAARLKARAEALRRAQF